MNAVVPFAPPRPVPEPLRAVLRMLRRHGPYELHIDLRWRPQQPAAERNILALDAGLAIENRDMIELRRAGLASLAVEEPVRDLLVRVARVRNGKGDER